MRFGWEDGRKGHWRMKKGHTAGCPGILPTANIPTPYALKASFRIFGWGMQTRIQNALQNLKKYGNLAVGEYSHALRLVCEHPDLRAANANPNPKRVAGFEEIREFRLWRIFARPAACERAPRRLWRRMRTRIQSAARCGREMADGSPKRKRTLI